MVKYVLAGCIGVVAAIGIAAAGASWGAALVGGGIAAVLLVIIGVVSWRRSHPPSVRT
jgi:hypothetical protein